MYWRGVRYILRITCKCPTENKLINDFIQPLNYTVYSYELKPSREIETGLLWAIGSSSWEQMTRNREENSAHFQLSIVWVREGKITLSQCMTEIQGGSILVQVGARFEVVRVQVSWGLSYQDWLHCQIWYQCFVVAKSQYLLHLCEDLQGLIKHSCFLPSQKSKYSDLRMAQQTKLPIFKFEKIVGNKFIPWNTFLSIARVANSLPSGENVSDTGTVLH